MLKSCVHLLYGFLIVISISNGDEYSFENELVLPISAINFIKTCKNETNTMRLNLQVKKNDILTLSKWFQKSNESLYSNDYNTLSYMVNSKNLLINDTILVNLKTIFEDKKCLESLKMVKSRYKEFKDKIFTKLKQQSLLEERNNKIYIITSNRGVNVRKNILNGFNSTIVDELPKNMILRLTNKIFLKGSWWGEFVYTKDTSKHLGWIEMSNTKQIQKD